MGGPERAAAVAKGGGFARVLTVGLTLVVAALVVSSLIGRWRPRLPRVLRTTQAAVVRVEVVNGSGESGVASRAASFLRDGGFQVVEIRNAERSDYFSTFVVARREDVTGAGAVSRYLGGAPVIRQAWGPDLADVSLVIGSDRSRLRLGD
jgi:hypothetical protein